MAIHEITQAYTTFAYLKPSDVLHAGYTGMHHELLLPAGKYKLECWGAQGGDRQDHGGYGGYTCGEIILYSPTTIFIVVGGQGGDGTHPGYNGGGCTRGGYQSGGGGTDIRIGTDSLYSRVIVAGGGGGAGGGNGPYYGGAAGGATGEKGYGCGGYGDPTGGTQTSGGVTSATHWGNTNGSFGEGGMGYGSSGSGGGGGWYGGGGALHGTGAGGSGYVYSELTIAYYPAGCTLTTNHFLTNTLNIDGNHSMPIYNSLPSIGKHGNGECAITVLSSINASHMFVENETKARLIGATITHAPTKTTYTDGEIFNPSGMTITLTYSNNTTVVLTDTDIQFNANNNILHTGDTSIVLRIYHKGNRFNITQPLTVS